MKLAAAIPLVFAVLGAAPALAQNCQMFNNACAKGPRVTANFQLSAPPPASASPSELTKALGALSQSLYEIIDRECDVLGAALKGDCRLVQININSNINDRMNNGVPFITANANATFEIDVKTPKDAAPQ
ncbi:MAG: hypothetical protein ACLQE9_08555 [Roseiarcus sp.]